MSGNGNHRMDTHPQIGWRLSGKILWEQISAFIAMNIVLFLLIALQHMDVTAVPHIPGLYRFLVMIASLHETAPWLNITDFHAILLVCLVEVIFLIGSTLRLRNAVRQQLAPLRELRTAADAYQDAVRDAENHSGSDGYSPEALRRMADTLRHVDAGDMDVHIATDAVSEELRPLADAINEMLERLELSYAAQAKFVSDASHELRTPIAVIQGYANMLSRWGSEDPDTLRESIDAIKSEADSMKLMVNQLLFLARGDNDTLHVESERFDVRDLLDEVFKEETMIDSGHVIKLNVPQVPVHLVGDAGLIKQLIRILVDNSKKYTPEGGQITLRLSSDDENIKIVVQDEGQGIPQDILPHIFDRFVRTDESRARNTGGAGLGLAIAKQIVERHGGYLEVYSREGIGSRFTVTL